MSLYLIDFENVHDSGLNGVTYLKETDDVFIFYSMKSEHMSFDTHVSIMKSAAKVKYIKLRRSAKNYLDFQLVTHLGYLIGSGQPGPYFIISKDTGYDSVLDYWKDHGVTVTRQPCIGYNNSSRKATGQAPVHNTPPALVTFKDGNTVSNFTVPIVHVPSSETPASGQDNIADTDNNPETAAEVSSIPEASASPDGGLSYEKKTVSETGNFYDEKTISDARTPSAVKSVSEAVMPSDSNEPEIQFIDLRDNSSEDILIMHPPVSGDDAESVVSYQASDNSQGSHDAEQNQNVPEKKSRQSRSRRSSGSRRKTVDASAVSQTQNTTSDQGSSSAEVSEPDATASSAPGIKDGPFTDQNAQDELVKIKPETLPESFRKRVRTVLRGKNLPSANYTSIYKAILNSYDKLALNNLLVKTFGSSKGGEIYNLIKEVFIDFQNS